MLYHSLPSQLLACVCCSDFGAGRGAALRQQYAQQITLLRTDLHKWATKQSKQVGTAISPPSWCFAGGAAGALSSHDLVHCAACSAEMSAAGMYKAPLALTLPA
jgi:hypothetical protein